MPDARTSLQNTRDSWNCGFVGRHMGHSYENGAGHYEELWWSPHWKVRERSRGEYCSEDLSESVVQTLEDLRPLSQTTVGWSQRHAAKEEEMQIPEMQRWIHGLRWENANLTSALEQLQARAG